MPRKKKVEMPLEPEVPVPVQTAITPKEPIRSEPEAKKDDSNVSSWPDSWKSLFEKNNRGYLVGLVGTIITTISLLATVYIYWISREKPDLRCVVSSSKAAVVRAGQASTISVQHEGKNVTGDITTSQIGIWNAGNKSIRKYQRDNNSNTLVPLTINIGKEHPILEATVRKQTRADIVNLAIDDKKKGEGEVTINWDILEQNDGGVIQLVYVGDEKVDIHRHAVIEGQRELLQTDSGITDSTSYESLRKGQRTQRQVALGSSGAYCLIGLYLIGKKLLKRRGNTFDDMSSAKENHRIAKDPDLREIHDRVLERIREMEVERVRAMTKGERTRYFARQFVRSRLYFVVNHIGLILFLGGSMILGVLWFGQEVAPPFGF